MVSKAMSADNGQVIKALTNAQALRMRPEATLGSKGSPGVFHTFKEIVGNALDERSSGHGHRMDVKVNPGKGVFAVRDYGRGVPMSWNEAEGEYNAHLIFARDNAGGKYDDNKEVIKDAFLNPEKYVDGGGTNLFTVGLNGKGAAATQFTSKYFKVYSVHDGVKLSMSFHEGIADHYEPIEEATDEPNGTYIEWRPDMTVFTAVKDYNNVVSGEMAMQFLRESSLTSGMPIGVSFYMGKGLEEDDKVSSEEIEAQTLYDHVQSTAKNEAGEEFTSEDKTIWVNSGLFFEGIEMGHDGEVRFPVKRLEYADGTYNESTYENAATFELAIAPKYQEGASLLDFFVNQVRTSSTDGVIVQFLKGAIEDFFLPTIKEKCGVKTFPRNIDIVANINAACSVKVVNPQFQGQTKNVFDNEFVGAQIFNTVKMYLQLESEKQDSWVKDWENVLVEMINTTAEQKELSRLQKEVNKETRNKRPSDKFSSCRAYQKGRYKDVELWLSEGDSAKGTIEGARDSEFQAIFPLRGKIINTYKAPPKKVLENKEVHEIMRILGCGINIPGQDPTEGVDIKKCRVGKLIIAADADQDGYHIRMLVFTLFWMYFRDLVFEDFLYAAESPLYVLEVRGKKYYARDIEELDALREKHGATSSNSKVSRLKGLGELDAEILEEVTVNPATRKLVPLRVDRKDEAKVDAILECFFGNDTSDRKELLLQGILVESDPAFRELVLESLSRINDVDEVEYVEIKV